MSKRKYHSYHIDRGEQFLFPWNHQNISKKKKKTILKICNNFQRTIFLSAIFNNIKQRSCKSKRNLPLPFHSNLIPVHNVDRPARVIIDQPVIQIEIRFFFFFLHGFIYTVCRYAGYSPRANEWNESRLQTWDEDWGRQRTKDDRFWYTLTPKISRATRLYSVAAPLWISPLNRIVSSTR